MNTKPLTNLLKKGVPFIWSAKAQQAYEGLKEALTFALTLMPLCFDRPFVLHTSVTDESLGTMLAQEDDSGTEKSIYFISHTIMAIKLNYSLAEKECLSLVHATKKFRHCLQGNTTKVIV